MESAGQGGQGIIHGEKRAGRTGDTSWRGQGRVIGNLSWRGQGKEERGPAMEEAEQCRGIGSPPWRGQVRERGPSMEGVGKRGTFHGGLRAGQGGEGTLHGEERAGR